MGEVLSWTSATTSVVGMVVSLVMLVTVRQSKKMLQELRRIRDDVEDGPTPPTRG